MAQRPFEPLPRAIFFDLDDTLCDYAAARRSRLRYAFSLGTDGQPIARPGVDLERMIAESIAMHPHGVDHFEALFARHGRLDPGEARAASDWYRTNRFHDLDLFPEADAVLRAVRRAQTPGPSGHERAIGIITNGPAEVQRAKFERLGLAELVDFVIISGEFGAAKPDRAVFEEALRRSGATAEDAIFVGDAPEFDIAGAQGAGIRSVWVNRDGVAWASPSAPPCRVIRRIEELPPLVGSDIGAPSAFVATRRAQATVTNEGSTDG
ncbi:MAG: HAD family hydrolase [Thermomicrobiales bacterium]|nr:HAD family hydrolase [Thermomicrobiales bacterium]